LFCTSICPHWQSICHFVEFWLIVIYASYTNCTTTHDTYPNYQNYEIPLRYGVSISYGFVDLIRCFISNWLRIQLVLKKLYVRRQTYAFRHHSLSLSHTTRYQTDVYLSGCFFIMEESLCNILFSVDADSRWWLSHLHMLLRMSLTSFCVSQFVG
jgi:hypothetical protein